MADLVQVFQHDEELKRELIQVTNQRLADKSCEFLDAVTHEFNDTIFRVLKMCMTPGIAMRLQEPELDT